MTAYKLHAARKKPDKREERLHKKLVHILRMSVAPDIYWFHPANGEKRHIRTAVILQEMGVQPGAPDLVFLSKGHFYGLELKAKGKTPSKDGKQTDNQVRAEADICAAGGTYAVATGIHEAMDYLIAWEIIDAQSVNRPSVRLVLLEAAA